MERAYDLLAGHPFLAGLSEAHLDKLAVWSRDVVLPAGTRLFEEGGRADRFWLVREGLVRRFITVLVERLRHTRVRLLDLYRDPS